ncbi:MAG: serine/threonine protein kinase [Pseudomonadota bacterium]|nr:serine/threonine protein kinase [Pseudomonadota bacterium]
MNKIKNLNNSLAYQDLRPDEIFDAIESLGFRSNGRLLALNSYENRVYQIGVSDSENIIIKFYRPGRWSDNAILEEHKFSLELALEEMPIVPPIKIHGQTLHKKNNFRFAVFKQKSGRAPELDDMKLLKQIGRLVARIHMHGEIYDFSDRPTLSIKNFGNESKKFLLEEGFIPSDLEPAYRSVCDALLNNIQNCYGYVGDLQYLRIHGDFHPSNVLVTSDQIHIVDLDDTRMGPAIQDIWMFLSGQRDEQTGQLNELLDGYTQFRSFNPIELHLVEALRSLRIMHYAAWLARRWEDPAFKYAFPWFNTTKYWDEHVLSLREQIALTQEPPLNWLV